MKLNETLTIEQAIRTVKRGGQNYFPKGKIVVVHDASTEERQIEPFTTTLTCDGEQWRLNGQLLNNKRSMQLRSGIITISEPMSMYEALAYAVKALQGAGQAAHGAINAFEDETFLRLIH